VPSGDGATNGAATNGAAVAPLRVCVLNDYEIVVRGLAEMLRPHAGTVKVVQTAVGLPEPGAADLVLYDTFGQQQANVLDIDDIVRRAGTPVVVFTWNLDRVLVEEAVRRGAVGYLSKGMRAADLVEALLRIRDGERLVPAPSAANPDEVHGAWPGKSHGLSAREAEMIALVAQGLSNQEIAERAYLSINSVKTYLRTGYRKLGIERRSQAVLWGLRHGLVPPDADTPRPDAVEAD